MTDFSLYFFLLVPTVELSLFTFFLQSYVVTVFITADYVADLKNN